MLSLEADRRCPPLTDELGDEGGGGDRRFLELFSSKPAIGDRQSYSAQREGWSKAR